MRPALIVILGLMVSPLQARAETALDLLDAPVAYTAQFSVTSHRGTYHGTVWHDHGRERRDVATTGGGQGLLLVRGDDAAYILGLGQRWYVGLSVRAAGALAGGLDGWQVRRTKMADETVNGIRATRWAVQAEGGKGGFSGDVWITREGVAVKVSGTIDNPSGDDSRLEMSLSGLKVGTVDRRMLELPQGWLGFDLRKIAPERVEQAIEGLRPMLEGRRGG